MTEGPTAALRYPQTRDLLNELSYELASLTDLLSFRLTALEEEEAEQPLPPKLLNAYQADVFSRTLDVAEARVLVQKALKLLNDQHPAHPLLLELQTILKNQKAPTSAEAPSATPNPGTKLSPATDTSSRPVITHNGNTYQLGCPEGSWNGRLDHKAWGRHCNLSLLFTDLDSGARYCFSVFANDRYRPRESGPDFNKEAEIGQCFALTTGLTQRGTPKFLNAAAMPTASA